VLPKGCTTALEVKIAVLGGGGTGRSTMTIRFVSDVFVSPYPPPNATKSLIGHFKVEEYDPTIGIQTYLQLMSSDTNCDLTIIEDSHRKNATICNQGVMMDV